MAGVSSDTHGHTQHATAALAHCSCKKLHGGNCPKAHLCPLGSRRRLDLHEPDTWEGDQAQERHNMPNT